MLSSWPEASVSKHPTRVSPRMRVYLYILRCRDGSYYVGTAQGDLERRLAQHDHGTFDGWTARRRPVELAYAQEFDSVSDANCRRTAGQGLEPEEEASADRWRFRCAPGPVR
ncbi:MAG: GIY-YIG nuclease family protein [Rhodovibrio sp.]|nr:GIY-YIG nuclease family protein [Rhodovibrio sp.]